MRAGKGFKLLHLPPALSFRWQAPGDVPVHVTTPWLSAWHRTSL